MSSSAATATADLLLVDADVVTLDSARPRASAVAVSRGVVVDVGGQEVVERWRGARTEVVALGGAALTPGWVDGHSHPVGSLTMSAGADLTGVRSLEQLRERLAQLARESTDGWVQGWGLVPDVFPGGVPRADLVDDALGGADGAKAFLRLADVHSALVSTSLLREAGIDGPRRFPSTAEVVCDPDGTPTGFLLEWDAMALADRLAPTLPDAQLRSRLRSLLDDMAAQGLVGAQVMDGDAASLDLLDRLEEDGDLPLRLRVAPFCMPGVDDDDVAQLVAWQERTGRRWRVAGVKLMIDGTVDGGTAWLDHPDANGQSTASFWRDPQAYARAVRALDAAGVPTVTHAIGDGGVRFVLDVLEPLGPPAPLDGPPGRRAAHRLEHLETLPDDLVARIGASGLTASVQPTHCTHFVAADGSDNWSVRLGPERAGRGWRVRDLLDAGALVVLGSDWPVADFDARAIMAAAQLRRPVEDDDAPPVGPEQATSAEEALAGFTRAPALAAGDASRGVIRVGAAADLTAVGADPTTAPPADLAAAPVLLTVVGGTPVHRTL
ncbi:amidohydrolase [Streptomyces sp. NP160]|uniref:amidohydrolase n=1 Tax=Streptomyces sp. NP160 TaxID=2586637 RepID=UPI0011188CB9|nr:amidohydrolase [Streptomyces sp. NP160]TNM64169.1 amidohydrolase [Streptomyces sp. NP160]